MKAINFAIWFRKIYFSLNFLQFSFERFICCANALLASTIQISDFYSEKPIKRKWFHSFLLKIISHCPILHLIALRLLQSKLEWSPKKKILVEITKENLFSNLLFFLCFKNENNDNYEHWGNVYQIFSDIKKISKLMVFSSFQSI